MLTIDADTRVEELVTAHPEAIRFLTKRGIVCMVCGEPFWGTLGELMQQKRIEAPAHVLADLRAFLEAES